VRDCDLIIFPVLGEDEAQYECQVGGSQPRLSPKTKLTVNIEPGQPHIEEETISLERGDTLEVRCESGGGRPAAELEWWNEDTGERIVSQVTQHVHRTGNTFRTISTLRTTADKNARIFCTASSPTFPAVKQSSALEVNIRGEPRLESVQLNNGESVKIFCHNNNRDTNLHFKWFINDKLIPDESRDVLEINQFSQSYDKSVVKCAAGNDEIVRAVQLRFNPEEKADSKIVSFDELLKRKGRQNDIMLSDEQTEEDDDVRKLSSGKTTFVCVVEDDEDVSSKEPKYVWVEGKLVSNTKATDKKNKSYKCKVVKNGSRKIEKMSKDLKSVSKTLRKMSKALNEFSK